MTKKRLNTVRMGFCKMAVDSFTEHFHSSLRLSDYDSVIVSFIVIFSLPFLSPPFSCCTFLFLIIILFLLFLFFLGVKVLAFLFILSINDRGYFARNNRGTKTCTTFKGLSPTGLQQRRLLWNNRTGFGTQMDQYSGL